jgi:hypothetical protein
MCALSNFLTCFLTCRSNDVIATKARNGLSRWRGTHTHLFDESLLRSAAAQIAQRPLSLPARRYVHNLFQSLE